jgi:hypothetical protein
VRRQFPIFRHKADPLLPLTPPTNAAIGGPLLLAWGARPVLLNPLTQAAPTWTYFDALVELCRKRVGPRTSSLALRALSEGTSGAEKGNVRHDNHDGGNILQSWRFASE